MLLRDLVTRLTFKVDTTPLKGVDRHFVSLKRAAIGLGTVLVGRQALITGGWLQALELQLKSLAGGSGPFKQLQKAMDELPAIFSKREAMAGLIGALQQGFGVNDVIKMMRESARLTARTNEGLDSLLPRFARMTKTGGMVEFLTSLGLIDERTERSLLKVTDKINQGAGLMSREMTRALGDMFRAMINQHGETLDRELVERSQLSVLKMQKTWTDMWDVVARLGVEALEPVLNWTADIVKEVDNMVKSYGGVKGVIEAISNLPIIKWWSGADKQDKVSPPGRPGYGLGMGGRRVPTDKDFGVGPEGDIIDRSLKKLFDFNLGPGMSEEEEMQDYQRRMRQMQKQFGAGKPLGMNIENLNINVSGVGNVEAVAQRVMEKFTDQVSRVHNDQIGGLEVRSIG